MRHQIAGVLALVLAACATGVGGDKGSATSAAYTAAIADAARPEADKARDADRKPAEMLAFAGVKPGSKIGELIPGGGYFTRIFSKAVGPTGKVYAVAAPQQLARFKPIADDKTNYPNVAVVPIDGGAGFKAPEQVDLVWTSQNYHDIKNLPVDINLYNKAVFDALKPGGVYVVLDHVAAANAPADVTKTLHRIPPELVKKEVTAVGFTFVGENNSLKNAADAHDKNVFDPALRGKTDQFVLKFKKPG